MLLLSVLRPSLEYGSEVWEGNKSQAASLESIMLGGAKRVLGCSSKTSNEAIWGDMGLEFLQGRRDKHKLSWWYKVVNMPLSRYPKQLFQEEWNIKPRPGRQRKVWKRVVDDIFESLELDKGEWVESISKGETSIKEFLALVDESIKESNRCQFLKGLNNKTKLTIYKTFGGEVKFKRYLNGVGDAGTRLLFKLRSGFKALIIFLWLMAYLCSIYNNYSSIIIIIHIILIKTIKYLSLYYNQYIYISYSVNNTVIRLIFRLVNFREKNIRVKKCSCEKIKRK